MFRATVLFCLLLVTITCHARRMDPTRPIQYQEEVKTVATKGAEENLAGRYKINSIIVSQYRRQAYINGNKVVEGDEMDGYQVVSINNKGVVLSKRGRSYAINLSGRSIKKTTDERSVKND